MHFKRTAISCLASVLISGGAQATCTDGFTAATSPVPILPGLLVFQAPDSSGATQLWMYDFSTGSPSVNISGAWSAVHTPINAVFSPNGQYIAFTACPNANCQAGRTDVWVWKIGPVGSSAAPANLTAAGSVRSEDPKWSPDGQFLAIKQNYGLAVLGLNFDTPDQPRLTTTQVLVNGVANQATEASQPVYSSDAKYLYYALGCYKTPRNSCTVSSERIARLDLTSRQKTFFSYNNGADYAYYPIVRDFSTIFYTGWTTPTGQNDQIFAKAPGINNYLQLPFNDCNSDNSDVTPVDSDYVLYSNDSSGVYKPTLAAVAGTTTWDLSGSVGRSAAGPIAGAILGMNYYFVPKH